jgi:ADP-ribosyl-[dinitrogen reductase] hydrolase
MREVLLLKGDTDTNAAIVGGMLGALHGATGIPAHMAASVLGRLGQAEARGPKRPDWLQPGKLPEIFADLYGMATGEKVDIGALPGMPPAAVAVRAALAMASA